MKITTLFFVILIGISLASCTTEHEEEGKHLFILSGQSNMARLDPEKSFTPALKEVFGHENILIAKDAKGTQPIRSWYRNWKPLEGDEPVANPHLYDSLMVKVNHAIENQTLASVTFVWMQGERDAREKLGEVYERSLLGLYEQLSADLNRTDVNFIIGRLSDFGFGNENYPHWEMVRDAQVKVGESNPRFAWINTDDLNDGLDANGVELTNDLHMSVEGYRIMGERFAGKAIQLIKSNK